jgi:hypothetical protein
MPARITNADEKPPTAAPASPPVLGERPPTPAAPSRGRGSYPRLLGSADSGLAAIATVGRIARHRLRGPRHATAGPDARQPVLPPGSGAVVPPTPPASDPRPLGEHLLTLGALAEADIDAALAEQRRTGGRLGDILVAGGTVDPAAIRLALAEQSNLPTLVPEYEAVPVLPRELAYQHRAAVLAGPARPAGAGSAVLLAVTDVASVSPVAAALGQPVEPRIADDRAMDALLADAYAQADGREASAAVRHGRHLLRTAGAAALGLVVLAAIVTLALTRPLAILPAVAGVATLFWLVMAPLAARSASARAAGSEATIDAEPPSCTVLVPLSRETPRTLFRLRQALDELDYPRHRLQGLALIDPADRLTRRWLRRHPLPSWVMPIVVPSDAAPNRRSILLYGLRQARGDLVAVARADGALVPDALRRAEANGVAADPAVSARRDRARRRLARTSVREAHATLPSLLAVAASGRARRSPMCFRTLELQSAFGWAPTAVSKAAQR